MDSHFFLFFFFFFEVWHCKMTIKGLVFVLKMKRNGSCWPAPGGWPAVFPALLHPLPQIQRNCLSLRSCRYSRSWRGSSPASSPSGPPAAWGSRSSPAREESWQSGTQTPPTKRKQAMCKFEGFWQKDSYSFQALISPTYFLIPPSSRDTLMFFAHLTYPQFKCRAFQKRGDILQQYMSLWRRPHLYV